MGARERHYYVCIKVVSENDGATYLRRGPQEYSEVLTVEKAVQQHGVEVVRRELEAALASLKKP